MPCTERLNLGLLFAKVDLSYCIQGSPVHENVPRDNSENAIFHHIGNITIYFQFFRHKTKILGSLLHISQEKTKTKFQT